MSLYFMLSLFVLLVILVMCLFTLKILVFHYITFFTRGNAGANGRGFIRSSLSHGSYVS